MLDLISERAIPIVFGMLVCLVIAVYLVLKCRRHLHEQRSAYGYDTQNYEQMELIRQRYCKELGHDLDSSCICRRCLMTYHDAEEIEREEVWIEDVPGATWLDSNFQPEGHHEYRLKYRCRRCDLQWVD